jgi:thioredoxin-dependent peroxiredoxin
MKVQIFAFAIFIFASFSMPDQQGLSLGDDAPVFKAFADDGSTWDIQNYLGKKYIVVYFYPAAMTGGCTKQACSYRDHREDLLAAGVEVVGVSGDKVESLRLFKQAENLNFTLLSDEKGEILPKHLVFLSVMAGLLNVRLEILNMNLYVMSLHGDGLLL